MFAVPRNPSRWHASIARSHSAAEGLRGERIARTRSLSTSAPAPGTEESPAAFRRRRTVSSGSPEVSANPSSSAGEKPRTSIPSSPAKSRSASSASSRPKAGFTPPWRKICRAPRLFAPSPLARSCAGVSVQWSASSPFRQKEQKEQPIRQTFV